MKCKKFVDIKLCLRYIILTDEGLPSSRGLGHIPFTDAAGVQIPLGVPFETGGFILNKDRHNIRRAERLFFIAKYLKSLTNNV